MLRSSEDESKGTAMILRRGVDLSWEHKFGTEGLNCEPQDQEWASPKQGQREDLGQQ